MIYDLINPSDPVTFVAEDDATAYAVALYLGRGKTPCTREDRVDLDTMLMFASEDKIKESVKRNLGTETVNEWIDANRIKFATALESFAYGSINKRKEYDDAIAAITDPEKLKEFTAKHEDRNRTSMNKWVDYAWKLAATVRKLEAEAKP